MPAFEAECFLISPIGEEGGDIRRRADGVRDYIIRPAVAELRLSAVRADDIAQPGQITLQVIQHVLEAKAAVADLTGANANVFYELAVRHTARLPVVLIAHVDDRTRLPFDIAQMRTIFYDHQDLKSAADRRGQITAQLREALEKGAVDSPVAASVNLAHLQGGNPSEQVLAQLVGTTESVAIETADIRRAVRVLEDRMAATSAIGHRLYELEERISRTAERGLLAEPVAEAVESIIERARVGERMLATVARSLSGTMSELLPDDARIFSTTQDEELRLLIETADDVPDEDRARATQLAETVGVKLEFVLRRPGS